MNVKRALQDPKTVLLGGVAGFIIRLFAKPLGAALFPVGSIYIAVLSMCLLPILIATVVTGIIGLLRDPGIRFLFKTMATY